MAKLGQAGLPTGLIGRLLGRIMAWHNGPDAEWTLGCLDVGDGDRVLEVGFGPGHALGLLARRHPGATAFGIDHSEAMLKAASARNREAVRAGRMELRLGSVTDLPFAPESFDRVFSIHCIYFWDAPVDGLKEIHRVLKPGGRLAVTVRDGEREAYRPFKPDGLETMFRQAGFSAVEIRHNDRPEHPLICAVGTQ